jgi:Domain of unknown function (DUF4345)
MRLAFEKIVLSVVSLFFLWTSCTSFRFPRQFAERLGFMIRGLDGLNEIRAQYGGFFLAAALVNALSLFGVLPRQTSFIVNAAIFGGLIIGRVASLAFDGGINGYGGTIRALFVIDSVGFALMIAAYFLERHLV